MLEKYLIPSKIFIALMDRLQDAVFVIKDGYCVYVNQRASELFGYTESELLELPFTHFVHKDDKDLVIKRHTARLEGEEVESEYSFNIVTKTGEAREVQVQVGVIQDDNGAYLSIGSLQDITEREKTKRALINSQADIESILNNLPDVFYRTDMNGVVNIISPSVREALGYEPDEMIGKPLRNFYWSPEEREKIVNALIEGNGEARHVEAWLRHKDGSRVWVSTNAYIRHDENGEPINIEGISRNKTESKKLEERLMFLARFDELTGVLNRRSFFEEAEYQIEIAHRYQRPVAMIMLDLDWFKSINDNFGHHVGDDALVYFADKCLKSFRRADLVGRMGGEEFAVLMPETEVANAKEILVRLKERLCHDPLLVNSQMIKITFSAGIVSLLEQDMSPDTMLIRADRLLYKAKEIGRDQIIEE